LRYLDPQVNGGLEGLARAAGGAEVPYNDEVRGSPVTFVRGHPRRLLVSRLIHSMSVTRQATLADDRAATQGTDRHLAVGQADRVACNDVIA